MEQNVQYLNKIHLISSPRRHCELYPNDRLPCSQLLKELREVVVHTGAGENHY